MTEVRIPFNIPYLTGNERDYMLDALDSRAHCGNRGYCGRCTDLLKERFGFGEVFLTTSCTTAMEMGALLGRLEAGDEVILPSYTFSSTANAVALRGARPVFCDVEAGTMNLDVSLLRGLITAKTKMIVPIDYAGIPCDIDGVMAVASEHGLIVMQDAAQSLASYHAGGRPCGAVPPLAAFSFHETKNFACGEGGALVVNDPELVERAHFLQEKGTDRSLVLRGVKSKYGWVDVGSSFLLADVLAAMLLAQLEALDAIVALRRQVAQAYQALFAPYEEQGCLRTPRLPEGEAWNGHAFFVILDTEQNQQAFLDRLKERGVCAYIGYVPLHSSAMGRRLGYRPEDVPRTEDLAARLVRLPFYADLAGNGLDYCTESIAVVLRALYD